MLNEKRRRFVREWVKLGNQTQAYLKVYKCKTEAAARSAAARLAALPEVAEYYNKLIEEERAKGIADVDEILTAFTDILRRNINDYAMYQGDVVEMPVRVNEMIRAGEALLKRLDIKKAQKGENENCGVIMMPEIMEE